MVRYINLLLFVFMIVMNYLANALPINGKTTGELSDAYPNLFVPAGLTFSIWGIIYLLLAVYCVIQFTSGNQAVIKDIGWLFALSSLLNGLWIIAWHYQKLPLSLLIMMGMLVTLTLINQRISPEKFGLIKAAFGIYLGWICIATIANITALLVNYGWGGFGISEVAWTVALILVGAGIVLTAVAKTTNPFIGLSAVWAFLGIAIKRQEDHRLIFTVAIIAMVLVAIWLVYSFIRKVA